MMRRLAQLIIVLVPIGLFVWLLVVDIAPSGTRSEPYTVGDESPFVDRLLPDERVEPIAENSAGEPFTRLIDEPVYFALHFPETAFSFVELEILFENHGQPILEVGPLVDPFAQAYDLKPLVNSLIDKLDWPSVQQDEIILYQREAKFDSVEAFLQNLPDRSRIATYHYDLETPYRLSGYQPLTGGREIDASLRGYHKFVTYVKNERVDFSVTFMDMNRTTGRDDVRVVMRNERGEPVAEKILDDDDNTSENQLSTTRTISLSETGLPEGVYSFELSGTTDIFWRHIETSLRYVTFVNQIFIGDDVGHLAHARGTEFFTNAKHLTYETYHSDSSKRVKIGNAVTEIPYTHEKVRADISEDGLLAGSTPSGDVKIVGDGKFSFSADAFFDPDPVRVTALTDLDALQVDYVVTTYTPPVREGNWFKQTVRFPMSDMRVVNNGATFALSAPLIAEKQNRADIHAMNVTFIKEKMSLKQFLAAVARYLPFGL